MIDVEGIAAEGATHAAPPAPASVGDGLPTVAILGLTGSGKTVLACTLARRLRAENATGVVWLPMGGYTLSYVDAMWDRLARGEWPGSNVSLVHQLGAERTSGEMPMLEWTLMVQGAVQGRTRLIDLSGQDFAYVFGGEQEIQHAAQRERLESLRAYCLGADIVLFLINLQDHIGQGDPDRARADQATIKGAIDALLEANPRRAIALVLTQSDLYEATARRLGGWSEVLRERVPYIHEAYCVQRPLPLFAVSAVANLEERFTGRGILRAPAPGFGSRGLQPLLTWMVLEIASRTHAPAIRRRTTWLLAIAGGLILGAVLIALRKFLTQ